MDSKRLVGGALGGLVGGVVFGAMMQTMGMMPMIAGLVGEETAAAGWLVHLGISIVFGLGYALTLGAVSRSWAHALGLGALYGAIWWVLGALLIMPAWMGMPVFQLGSMQLQSLVGHVVYGVTLGLVVHAVLHANEGRHAASRA